MRVVLSQIVFDLLHHFEEIVEADEVRIMVSLWPNLHEQLFGLFWVSLKTLHDGLQIFDVDATDLLLVEKVEDLFQVLHFFLRELQSLLLHRLAIWVDIFLLV